MPRTRFQLETTLYGKRLVSRGQLYELHREVSRAAQLARQDDPRWVDNYNMGRLARQSGQEREASAA